MSVAEIIKLIKKLPREEQEQVFAFVKSLVESGALLDEAPVRYMEAGEKFKQMADEMFTTHAELFRKLAQ